METEIEGMEERLQSFLAQLQAECGIFERMVYKNKNQHRRCSYFRYLLKVRRDLRLLQSAKLEEILGSCFHVITGKKPKKKVHLLESLKWTKLDGGTPNFMERLLGAARLLSQMVEPMLKAATEVSILLARSFFMGFSLTILALLARLRVLVQQILLDVILLFNMVSSISQKKQSVKITREGIEVFREYYPTNKEFVTLECVWKTDKFILLERTHNKDVKVQDGDLGDAPGGTSALRYWTIESFLGDDDSEFEKVDGDYTTKEGSTGIKEDKKVLFWGTSILGEDREQVKDDVELGDNPATAEASDQKHTPERGLLETPQSSKPLAPTSTARQMASVSVKRGAPSPPPAAAFVPVKRPATSTANVSYHDFKETDNSDHKEDSFFNLLAAGTLKDSLF